MNLRLFLIILIFIIKQSFTPSCSHAFDSIDAFIEDNVNLDEILDDLPLSVYLKNNNTDNLKKLPYFDSDTIDRFNTFIETSKNNNIISGLKDFQDFSPVQKSIVDNLTGYNGGFSMSKSNFYTRSGLIYRPDKEKTGESKYYLKTGFNISDNIKFAFLGERDYKEPRAFDLYSANLRININENGSRLIIGDFRPGYGQGFLFGRYRNNFTDWTNIRLKDSQIIENNSFEESLFLRGAYLIIKNNFFESHIWGSSKKTDASLDENGKVISIKETGLHYSGTPKNNLKENTGGVRFVYNNDKSFKLGISGVFSDYSPGFGKTSDEKYINRPNGSAFGYFSFDSELKSGSSLLFTETVLTNNNESALTAGLVFKKDFLQSCVQFRNFSRNYFAPHSGSYSSFGAMSNENGVYSAFKIDKLYGFSAGASMDIAETKSRTYFDKMPVSRKRMSFFVSKDCRGVSLGFIAKSVSDSTDIYQRNIYRMQADKKIINETSGIRTIMAWSESRHEGGYYFETGIFSKPKKIKYDISLGMFDIPSYNSRFYRFEHNVPGRCFSSAVWGKGVSGVILLSVNRFSIQFRFIDSDLTKRTNEVTFQSEIIF